MIAKASEVQVSLLPTAVNLVIRFSDVDMMQVVHHAAYFQFFEQLRFTFMQRILELDVPMLRDANVVCPVIDLEARYLRSLNFQDRPTGFARFRVARNATFRFDYWIYRALEDEKPCVIGSTRHCFATSDLQLLLRTPDLFEFALKLAQERFPGCFASDAGPQPIDTWRDHA